MNDDASNANGGRINADRIPNNTGNLKGRGGLRMTGEHLNGWDEKPRTVPAINQDRGYFLLPAFRQAYSFGQILSKIATGHVAAIFDVVSEHPEIAAPALDLERLSVAPLVIDSYSLFDKKREGDWRIIGHREPDIPAALKDTHFVYRMGDSRKKVDLWG